MQSAESSGDEIQGSETLSGHLGVSASEPSDGTSELGLFISCALVPACEDMRSPVRSVPVRMLAKTRKLAAYKLRRITWYDLFCSSTFFSLEVFSCILGPMTGMFFNLFGGGGSRSAKNSEEIVPSASEPRRTT